MSEMMSRVKRAAKCLLGRDRNVSRHEYKLNIVNAQRFAGKSIIVTGGTGAIGSGICYELAASGALVGMCGRSEEKVASVISNIKNNDPNIANKIIPVTLDITNEKQIEEAIANYVSKTGAVDVFINNAGGQPGRVGSYSAAFEEQDFQQIKLVIETNLTGGMLCSKVALQYMIKQGHGHIINMSSVIGIGGREGMCDYAAAKAGVIGFTKSLALEVGKKGIRVNCISPGFINQTLFDGGSPIKETSQTVLGRHGYTREIASAVGYLIENEFITGQNLIIDGGRSLGLYGDH